MTVKILKETHTKKSLLSIGEVLFVSKETAAEWIALGIAEQAKKTFGPQEFK